MSTSDLTVEPASRFDARALFARPVLLAISLVFVVLASHLPLVWQQFRSLWLTSPHYEFFPLLLVAIVWLLWKRNLRWTTGEAAPAWSSVLLSAGWMLMAASTVLWSPWLSVVAMIVSVGGLIGRFAAAGQWREWVPVWLLMWLIVPPPRGLEMRLISWLQSSTTQTASHLLDLLRIMHLMDGHVLVLPGHRMLVDEACSGVNSVLVLLVLTATYVVAVRRPLLRSILLVASGVPWAWAGNTVRVTTIAVAQAWADVDLSTGWQHEVLGYVTLSLALIWLISTDYLLDFLLRPIRVGDTRLSPYYPDEVDTTNRLLITVWNRSVGATDDQQRDQPVAGSAERPEAAVVAATKHGTGTAAACWLIAFGVFGVLQFAGVTLLRSDAIPVATLFQETDLPEELEGWTKIGYELEERPPSSRIGQRTNKWVFQRGEYQCITAVDYPFAGWHDLTICYRGNGWTLDNRYDTGDRDAGQAEGRFVEADLSRPTGERGWLVFGAFDQQGRNLVPTGRVVGELELVHRLGRNPLVAWLLGQGYVQRQATTLQVQAFMTGDSTLSDDERAAVQQLFLAVRRHVLDAYRARGVGEWSGG